VPNIVGERFARETKLRFKVGDPVLILTRYAHLYPSGSGVIVAVGSPDPFRSEFNEYTVKFPDGASAKLFEFQLVKVE
jgi:hypothetical protein